MIIDYHSIIRVVPGIHSGKPIIRGTRITIHDVLSFLASGISYAEIIDEFPPLRKEDILACLSFAAERERQMTAV